MIRLCTVLDCGKSVATRGWCSMHYQRWKRYGDIDATPRFTRDPMIRFWRFVHKTDTCWLWTGALKSSGYGHFTYGPRTLGRKRRTVNVHRFAYEAINGPVPSGLQLDHLCRVRCCVNPDHLEPVTPGENTRRGAPAQKTHCKYGHEFTPENTYRQPTTGRRSCWTCKCELARYGSRANVEARRFKREDVEALLAEVNR